MHFKFRLEQSIKRLINIPFSIDMELMKACDTESQAAACPQQFNTAGILNAVVSIISG